MIICPDLGLVFCHAAKTGGSAITKNLRGHASTVAGPAREPGNRGWQSHYHTLGGLHGCYDQVAGKVDALVASGWTYACATRNPWHRVWSMWHHQRAWFAEHQGWNPDLALEDWILKAAPGNLKGMRWMVPVVEQAGERVTFWVDFHDLQSSWTRLCDRLAANRGVPDPGALGLVTRLDIVNDRPMEEVPYSDAWSTWAIDWVEERFKPDIDAFGYDFSQEP